MNRPLVSVIMPVYNGEKYIKRAVESVYEQGISLELLVIDDGSTDGTEEVLSAYVCRKLSVNMLHFWMQMTGGTGES